MLLKNNLDLVILCGGIGSRLGNLTKKTPKPLLKINKKPFIEYLIKKYQKYNFKKIFLLANYKSNQFKKKYHNKYFNLSKCTVISEKVKKGTAGCLYDIKSKIRNNFLLINGDSFLDEDLDNFLELKKKYTCKMILTKNKNYLENQKLSCLNINKRNMEIVLSKSKKNSFMNSGIYLLSKKIFKYINNKYMSLENDVLPKLIKQKLVYGIFSNSFFIDIGTKKNFNLVKKKFNNLKKNKAIFFDRDGTINHDTKYLHKTKDIKWNYKIKNFLKKINKEIFYKFIVTNQSGIGRGYFSNKKFIEFQKNYYFMLSKDYIFFDDIMYCPHHPSKAKKNCSCRKPNNSMIEKLLKRWQINRKNAGMIGDQYSDYRAAKKSKIKFIYASAPKKKIYDFIKKI
jgi:D,D-heptose 1,7-bisphosphate phosphatase